MHQATAPPGMHQLVPDIQKPTAGMDQGKRISKKDEELLFEYCNRSEVSQLMALLSDPETDINYDCRDEKGRSCVHWAAIARDIEILEVLVKCQFPTRSFDNEGMIPLHLAILANNQPAIDILMEYGADPNIQSMNPQYDGWTALHFTCMKNPSAVGIIMEKILKDQKEAQEANPPPPPKEGEQPDCSIATTRKLMEFGADPNIRTRSGFTPLQVAAHSGELTQMAADKDALKAAQSDLASLRAAHEALQRDAEKLREQLKQCEARWKEHSPECTRREAELVTLRQRVLSLENAARTRELNLVDAAPVSGRRELTDLMDNGTQTNADWSLWYAWVPAMVASIVAIAFHTSLLYIALQHTSALWLSAFLYGFLGLLVLLAFASTLTCTDHVLPEIAHTIFGGSLLLVVVGLYSLVVECVLLSRFWRGTTYLDLHTGVGTVKTVMMYQLFTSAVFVLVCANLARVAYSYWQRYRPSPVGYHSIV